MYKREAASELRQAFWTAFGQQMAQILSAEGLPVNWINYRTRVKHVLFRTQAEGNQAWVSIDIVHPDPGLRDLLFDQFEEFKILLHSTLGEEWIWDRSFADELGHFRAKIYTRRQGISVLDQQHWPVLMDFFRPRLVALDAFWADAYYTFQDLQ
ncbi:MAG: DUF4268 domain-containing protein [Cytophagales bacterium]|nr:DUF4268 domain-containing protein [Cytophagales bacterium]